MLERPELFAEALVELERAVREEPQNADVWIAKGVLTRRMAEMGTWIPETLLTAEADLMHAVDLAPAYYDAHLELSKTRRLMEKFLKRSMAYH